MIISRITSGMGNQLFQYAFGRCLAYKHNTELKLDLTFYDKDHLRTCILNLFNTTSTIATPEEIQRIKENSSGIEKDADVFIPEALDYPDNIWLQGYWINEKYFADIADIIREEFTLKQPLGSVAQRWKEKILATENSVSVHIRHGDFAYNPNFSKRERFALIPLDYYHKCIKLLKQQYKDVKFFIFSDNLNWCKENFRTDVSIEFIEGVGLQDFEELCLMSLCKHNITANSTFSWWGAWLNRNPDKKVFVPIPSKIIGTKETYRRFSAERDENSSLDSDRWIRVPFDLNNQPDIMMRPYFSFLLVVNDDAATLNETLDSILGQEYRYYEVIIIDNASTDGSNKICQQAANTNDKITLIELQEKISIGAAYNKAINLAQGNFVLFLKGNDKIFPDALTSLYLINERVLADVVDSVLWVKESERGNIDIADKKFVVETNKAFRGSEGNIRAKLDKPTLLKIFAANDAATPLASKVFKRKFLTDNGIRFNEKIGKEAERLFMVNAMLQADEMIFTPNMHYIAPRK